MRKQFEIVFVKSNVSVTADLLEDKAPITCDNFWKAIEKPHQEKLNHAWECGAEIWCYVPPPKEEIPYENATVFPSYGDILYYHFIQPPTREGKMVYDIGMFWERSYVIPGLATGWLPGNLFARINGWEKKSEEPWNWDEMKILRREAARLLVEGPGTVILRRNSKT